MTTEFTRHHPQGRQTHHFIGHKDPRTHLERINDEHLIVPLKAPTVKVVKRKPRVEVVESSK